MRTSLIRLGKGFGQLPLTGGVGIRGVTKYHLSPFEQKAFAGVLTTGIPNFFRRVKGEFLNVVPRKLISFWPVLAMLAYVVQISYEVPEQKVEMTIYFG